MPTYIKPFGFIMFRVCSAAILFTILHAVVIKERVVGFKDYRDLFICAFFGAAANMLMFFHGLNITKPINASVLMMNTPIFVVLLAALINKERLTWLKVVGILSSATGAVLLLSGKNFDFSGKTFQGDLFVTLNAISYAMYLVYVKRVLNKYKPVTVAKWVFVFGSVLVIPFGFNEFTEVQWQNIPSSIWGAIAFVIVGTTFMTYLLNSWALKKATSSLVGSYIYLQPVLATLIAVIAGKDELSPKKIIFTLLIFAGVYMVNLQFKRRKTNA